MTIDPASEENANVPCLSDATFSFAFDRFCKVIEAKSGESFKDFYRGLPNDWEGYKEWVYHEGRRILGSDCWKKTDIGKGEILKATIAAIELHSSAEYRNNLVQWDARYGEETRAHKALLKAVHHPESTQQVEKELYALYKGKQSDEASVFSALIALLGKRYDLLAYLFFLKDWSRFMPVRPSTFSKAFDYLRMPHPMTGKCSWGNYQGYLQRLSLVRQKLSEFQIPGNRLLDAHSFCWILTKLWDETVQKTMPESIYMVPKTAVLPVVQNQSLNASFEKTPDDYLKEAQDKQKLGALAQSLVLQAEVDRLQKQGKEDLAMSVKDVSTNPSLGYDIESFQADGSPKRIEVKAASTGNSYWRFYLSENELVKSKQLEGYVFALVGYIHSAKPCIWEFPSMNLPNDALRAITYQVYLQAP